MFEEEAKEYEDDYVKSAYYEHVSDTWKNGAVFGYNKANEWHNLRKHQDDLPKEGETVLCYCLEVYGAPYPITAYMTTDCYDAGAHYWWTLGNGCAAKLLDNVVAWKEIAAPMGIVYEEETD